MSAPGGDLPFLFLGAKLVTEKGEHERNKGGQQTNGVEGQISLIFRGGWGRCRGCLGDREGMLDPWGAHKTSARLSTDWMPCNVRAKASKNRTAIKMSRSFFFATGFT